MGCDIHTNAEVFNKETQKWEGVGKIFDNPYFKKGNENKVEIEEDGSEWETNPEFIKEPYKGRNYGLFSILAGVRNYGTIIPIADDKGIPADVSQEIGAEHTRWGADVHSASYLTVQELLAFDWEQTIKETSSVKMDWYEAWLLKGKKGNPVTEHIPFRDAAYKELPEEEMEKILSSKSEKLRVLLDDVSYFCQMSIDVPYSEFTKAFLTKTIPALQKLGEPEDVRMVFWFDN